MSDPFEHWSQPDRVDMIRESTNTPFFNTELGARHMFSSRRAGRSEIDSRRYASAAMFDHTSQMSGRPLPKPTINDPPVPAITGPAASVPQVTFGMISPGRCLTSNDGLVMSTHYTGPAALSTRPWNQRETLPQAAADRSLQYSADTVREIGGVVQQYVYAKNADNPVDDMTTQEYNQNVIAQAPFIADMDPATLAAQVGITQTPIIQSMVNQLAATAYGVVGTRF